MKIYEQQTFRTGVPDDQRWPNQYLHVTECQSGEQWICPLTAWQKLDIVLLVKRFVKLQFSGELKVSDIQQQPSLDGEFYATVRTDGRNPESCVVWDSCGFWLKGSYE